MEKEIGRETANWNHSTQDRGQKWAVVNTVMNFWFLKIQGTFLTSRATTSFSRRIVLVNNRNSRDIFYDLLICSCSYERANSSLLALHTDNFANVARLQRA